MAYWKDTYDGFSLFSSRSISKYLIFSLGFHVVQGTKAGDPSLPTRFVILAELLPMTVPRYIGKHV